MRRRRTESGRVELHDPIISAEQPPKKEPLSSGPKRKGGENSNLNLSAIEKAGGEDGQRKGKAGF